MENNIEFVDPESYGGKQEFSFKQIVMGHLQRITRLASVELRGGYYQNRILKLHGGVDGTIRIWIPDSRESLSNAIDMLYMLLHNKFDEIIKKEVKEIEKKKWKDSDSKVKIKKEMLLSLCDFLSRMNYFEASEEVD